MNTLSDKWKMSSTGEWGDAHSAEKCQVVLQPFLCQVICISCFKDLEEWSTERDIQNLNISSKRIVKLIMSEVHKSNYINLDGYHDIRMIIDRMKERFMGQNETKDKIALSSDFRPFSSLKALQVSVLTSLPLWGLQLGPGGSCCLHTSSVALAYTLLKGKIH